MKTIILCAITLFSLLARASNDYFDQLQHDFESTPTGRVRRFYIAAEEVIWDYASETSSKANVPDANLIGTRYHKALYHEYEDSKFLKRKPRPHWQGNMGPILRAEVGDVIQVFFWNRATKNFTIHPHGIFYEFEMEGAIFKDSYAESSIAPNQNYTYTWNVLPRAGPGPKDGDSIVWGYHSHVTENDLYAGLYGAIVVYKPGALSDEQIVTSVYVSDENLSPYFHKTMSTLYPDFDRSKYTKKELYRASQFHCINGLVSSSPSDIAINASSDWHLLGWGTYWDVKYLKWEHSRIKWYGKIVDSVRIMPASFYTATVIPKKTGRWLFGSLDNKEDGMTMEYSASL